tara:strand:+ start:383 stop:1099 length:717 start_codon:yes stop_codon:yes gene_type:complete
MIVTCGDSFACFDKRESKELQWPVYVARNLGYISSKQLHLGRGASDNWYIYLQARWALENHNIDYLLVWWTSTERFFVRHPDTEETKIPLAPNQVATHINLPEINHDWKDYDPQYISETYNNVIHDSDFQFNQKYMDECRARHNLLEEDWIVLQKYWEKFHSSKKNELELETMQYVIKHMCKEKKIKYISLPDEHLKNLKAEELDTDILCNHFGIRGHKAIGDYILNDLLLYETRVRF